MVSKIKILDPETPLPAQTRLSTVAWTVRHGMKHDPEAGVRRKRGRETAAVRIEEDE